MSRHRHTAVAAAAVFATVGRAVAGSASAQNTAGVQNATATTTQNATATATQNATATTTQNATATATQNATATATQNATVTATGTPSIEGLSTAAVDAQTAAAPALEFGTPIAPGVAGLVAGVGLGLVVATAVVYWGVGE